MSYYILFVLTVWTIIVLFAGWGLYASLRRLLKSRPAAISIVLLLFALIFVLTTRQSVQAHFREQAKSLNSGASRA